MESNVHTMQYNINAARISLPKDQINVNLLPRLSTSPENIIPGHEHVLADSTDSTDPISLSLKVCQECQNLLINAFNHCLSSKDSENQNSLFSVHEIDEIKDGIATSEQPYNNIVNDPTISIQKPKFKSTREHVEMDRWVHAQHKKSTAESNNFQIQVAKSNTAKHAHSNGSCNVNFSGTLYKRMLDYKDREIKDLRMQLYQKSVMETHEANNVNKLRNALNKAVKFYTFAEEWQSHESQRLAQDIRFLKTQFSSLMAFLLNSEEEKRSLRVQIEEVNGIIKIRDMTILDLQNIEQELRSKLHGCYKEFIEIDKTMENLKREAVMGTEAVESRNNMLQRNLEKVAIDFEAASRELSDSKLKIRECEFELEELLLQFNMTGESKKKSEELNIRITNDLEIITQVLKDTQEKLENTSLERIKWENEYSDLKELYDSNKRISENKINQLTADINQLTAQRNDLDSNLKLTRAENERLNGALKYMTKSKDTLELQVMKLTEKYEQQIISQDAKITGLETKMADKLKEIKIMTDSKEQLRLQVNELQISSNREIAQMNVLNFEIAQLKRVSLDKITTLEDQVEKLTFTRNTLLNEKKALAEKLKVTRNDLRLREEELDALTSAHKKLNEDSIRNDKSLREQLGTIKDQYQRCNEDLTDLKKRYHDSVETNVRLVHRIENSENKLAEANQREQINISTIKQLEKDKAEGIETNKFLQGKLQENLINLASASHKIDELKTVIRTAQEETSAVLKEKNHEISKLNNDLYSTREEETRVKKLNLDLKIIAEGLDKNLAKALKTVADVTLERDLLDSHVHDTQLAFKNEKRTRQDFEQMNSRIDKMDKTQEIERLHQLKIRNSKLEQLSIALTAQYSHLTSLALLLPEKLNFGDDDPIGIPLFRSTDGSDGLKRASVFSLKNNQGKSVGAKAESSTFNSLPHARRTSSILNNSQSSSFFQSAAPSNNPHRRQSLIAKMDSMSDSKKDLFVNENSTRQGGLEVPYGSSRNSGGLDSSFGGSKRPTSISSNNSDTQSSSQFPKSYRRASTMPKIETMPE